MSWKLSGRVLVSAALLCASPSLAGEPVRATVDFAPRAAMQLERYGDNELLRSAILAALARETGRVPTPRGLTVTVLVKAIEPTRPTRAEQNADPAVDPVKSKHLGGAELVGYIRDAQGNIATTVTYRYFPVNIGFGSVSSDAWADARLAIDQFAVNVAAACRDLPGSVERGS